jgi:hypothetical protein
MPNQETPVPELQSQERIDVDLKKYYPNYSFETKSIKPDNWKALAEHLQIITDFGFDLSQIQFIAKTLTKATIIKLAEFLPTFQTLGLSPSFVMDNISTKNPSQRRLTSIYKHAETLKKIGCTGTDFELLITLNKCNGFIYTNLEESADTLIKLKITPIDILSVLEDEYKRNINPILKWLIQHCDSLEGRDKQSILAEIKTLYRFIIPHSNSAVKKKKRKSPELQSQESRDDDLKKYYPDYSFETKSFKPNNWKALAEHLQIITDFGFDLSQIQFIAKTLTKTTIIKLAKFLPTFQTLGLSPRFVMDNITTKKSSQRRLTSIYKHAETLKKIGCTGTDFELLITLNKCNGYIYTNLEESADTLIKLKITPIDILSVLDEEHKSNINPILKWLIQHCDSLEGRDKQRILAEIEKILVFTTKYIPDLGSVHTTAPTVIRSPIFSTAAKRDSRETDGQVVESSTKKLRPLFPKKGPVFFHAQPSCKGVIMFNYSDLLDRSLAHQEFDESSGTEASLLLNGDDSETVACKLRQAVKSGMRIVLLVHHAQTLSVSAEQLIESFEKYGISIKSDDIFINQSEEVSEKMFWFDTLKELKNKLHLEKDQCAMYTRNSEIYISAMQQHYIAFNGLFDDVNACLDKALRYNSRNKTGPFFV